MLPDFTTPRATMDESTHDRRTTRPTAGGSSSVDRMGLLAMLAVALLVPATFERMPVSVLQSTLATAAAAVSPYPALAAPAEKPDLDDPDGCSATR